MRTNLTVMCLAAILLVSGCAAKSSMTEITPQGPPWEGPVLVSPSPVPAGIAYKEIGSISANAYSGYDEVERLYPLLAAKAKKLGANAVVNVKGSRRVTATSWSAAYVSGTAIRVDDVNDLKGIPGTYH